MLDNTNDRQVREWSERFMQGVEGLDLSDRVRHTMRRNIPTNLTVLFRVHRMRRLFVANNQLLEFGDWAKRMLDHPEMLLKLDGIGAKSQTELLDKLKSVSSDSGEPVDLAEIIDDLKWAQEYLEQARQKIERWEQLRIQPELGVNPEAPIKSEGVVTEVTDRPDMVIGED